MFISLKPICANTVVPNEMTVMDHGKNFTPIFKTFLWSFFQTTVNTET